jgi:hypothetical protein
VAAEVRQLVGGGANLAKFDDEIILMWVRVTVKEGLSKCRVSALVAVREDVAYPSAAANPDTNPDIGIAGRSPTATTPRATGTSTAAPRSVTRPPPLTSPPASNRPPTWASRP